MHKHYLYIVALLVIGHVGDGRADTGLPFWQRTAAA